MKSFKELRGMLSEAYSKNLSDKEIDQQIKKFGSKAKDFFGDLDKARADMKKDYSPKRTARPKAWTSLGYPVRDGDYYFAFISKDEKKNTKFNDKLNDILRNVGRGRIVGGVNKAKDLANEIWAAVSKEVKKFPRDLGWGDTMTRDEIYHSILHMIAYPGVKEQNEEVAIDKFRVGKRMKSPKYESVIGESDANWAKSLEKINKQRQLDKISDKDKETLMKIAALLGKEKKKR